MYSEENASSGVQVRQIFLDGRLHVAKMFETAADQSEVEALHQELWALARLESLWVGNGIIQDLIRRMFLS